MSMQHCIITRLIEAGDLPTIVRRLLVISYEDVGLASPNAGQRTLAAIQSAERLGFPEARIPLSQAVIELCLSPKSIQAFQLLILSDIRQGKSRTNTGLFKRWPLCWC